jgi:hypothetical protein
LSSTRNRFLVAAAIFCCSHAHGALSDEIQVYTDDVNAPGERGSELHVNTTPSVNFGVGRGLNGATDRWTVKAIYSF